MVVADASILVEYLLRTGRGLAAEAYLTTPGADVHVPALCDVEVAAALRALLLRGAITVERCEQAVAAYLDLPLTRHGHTRLLPRALALRDNFTAYDGTFVALAEQLGAVFLTGDRRLARAVEAHTAVGLVRWNSRI